MPHIGETAWLMLPPSASAPELEAEGHCARGPLFLQPPHSICPPRQLHLPAWWVGFGSVHSVCWHCGRQSVFLMGLWRVGMEREKDISVPRWVLYGPLFLLAQQASQILMGLVWLCVCREDLTDSYFLVWRCQYRWVLSSLAFRL